MDIKKIEKELYYTIKRSLNTGLGKKDYYYWRDILSNLYGEDIKYNSPYYIIINAIEELLGLINDSGIMHKYNRENIKYIVDNTYLLPLVLANNGNKQYKIAFENSYMFVCPFHDDKHPSFSVTDNKNLGHCFGCDKTVNVVSYIREIEKLSFTEAIELFSYIYMFDLKQNNDKLRKLSQKYKETILSDEYKKLLDIGCDRLIKKYGLNEDIETMYQKRFNMIDRIKNNEYDSNFHYIENPKTIKLTLNQIK